MFLTSTSGDLTHATGNQTNAGQGHDRCKAIAALVSQLGGQVRCSLLPASRDTALPAA